MEGIITFKFKGLTLFKADVWDIAALLVLPRSPFLQSMPDAIFIDDQEILEPKNMEDAT